MKQAKVLITGALHESAIGAFRAQSSLLIQYLPDAAREEVEKHIGDATVIITRSETDVDRALIDRAPQLKIIGRAAVGVGNIDIEYATERGILVINCPGKNTNSAAELTMGLMLSMFRKLPSAQLQLKNGGWDRHRFTGYELRGKRLGIVGLGNVGHRVAHMAHGFDMEVFGYDPYISNEPFQRHNVHRCSSLRELASQVDILTLHVPLNKETKGFITSDILGALPRGSYIVNAARGGLIDEDELVKALEEGHLAGAAIDTFLNEPKPLPALIQHERVWCSPHIGASTVEAQIAIGATIFEQITKALDGGVVDYPVNLPQIGVIDNVSLKSYAILAEKLGSLAGQILEFSPERVEILYRGDIAALDHALVRLSWMKGYAGHVVDDYVSFVNVESHFAKLGIKLSEREDPGFEGYKSALKVVVHGLGGEALTVGGIVFDDRLLRVSLINDFHFEMDPRGEILLIENHDRPGVIGDVGSFLAAHGMNISTFELSRNRKGGRAMSLVRLDSELSPQDLQAMTKIKNILNVRAVHL